MDDLSVTLDWSSGDWVKRRIKYSVQTKRMGLAEVDTLV